MYTIPLSQTQRLIRKLITLFIPIPSWRRKCRNKLLHAGEQSLLEQLQSEVRSLVAAQHQQLLQLQQLLSASEQAAQGMTAGQGNLWEITAAQTTQLMQRIDCLSFSQKLLYGHLTQGTAAYINGKAFAGYKGKLAGKDAVLAATGPTLLLYSPGTHTRIHLGVNAALKRKDMHFDYIFAQDNGPIARMEQDMINATNVGHFFIGNQTMDVCVFPQASEALIDRLHASRYLVKCDVYQEKIGFDCTRNIEVEPLADWGSIVFPAMQFLLYTRPKRIFLVGCDTAPNGYFNKDAMTIDPSYMLPGWKKVAAFAQKYHPDVEIISVNPIGLKGLFRDVYTANNPNRPEDAEIWKP